MLKHSLIIGLVVLLGAGCSKDDEPLFFIEGRVVDDFSGRPIEGALVEFKLHGAGAFEFSSIGSVVSGPNGGFVRDIPLVDAGLISFGKKEPWVPSHVNVTVSEDYCTGSDRIVEVSNSFTDFVEIRVTPLAYVRATIENVGAYQGDYDQVVISNFGSVSLEPGFIDSRLNQHCSGQQTLLYTVKYRLNSDVVHEIMYPLDVLPSDTVLIHMNY